MAAEGKQDLLHDFSPLAHPCSGAQMFAHCYKTAVYLPRASEDRGVPLIGAASGESLLNKLVETVSGRPDLAIMVKLLLHLGEFGTQRLLAAGTQFVTAHKILYSKGLVCEDGLPSAGASASAILEELNVAFQSAWKTNDCGEQLSSRALRTWELVSTEMTERVAAAPLLRGCHLNEIGRAMRLFGDICTSFDASLSIDVSILADCCAVATGDMKIDDFVMRVERRGSGLWQCHTSAQYLYAAIKYSNASETFQVLFCNAGVGAYLHCRAKHGCVVNGAEEDVLVPMVVVCTKPQLMELLPQTSGPTFEVYHRIRPLDIAATLPTPQLSFMAYRAQSMTNSSVHNMCLAFRVLFNASNTPTVWAEFLQAVAQHLAARVAAEDDSLFQCLAPFFTSCKISYVKPAGVPVEFV